MVCVCFSLPWTRLRSKKVSSVSAREVIGARDIQVCSLNTKSGGDDPFLQKWINNEELIYLIVQ